MMRDSNDQEPPWKKIKMEDKRETQLTPSDSSDSSSAKPPDQMKPLAQTYQQQEPQQQQQEEEDRHQQQQQPPQGGSVPSSKTTTEAYKDPNIRIPSIDKAMPPMTVTNVRMFQGASSLSMFGLEIEDVIPHGPSCRVDLNEKGTEPVDNISQHCKVIRNGNYVQCSLKRSHGRELRIEFQLADYKVAEACLNIFNTYLSGCFYFFNTGEFKRQMYQTYYGQEPESYTRRDIFWLAKLLLVTGIGEMYLGRKSGEPVERYPGMENYPGMYYFDRAGDVLNMAFDGRIQFHGYSVEAVEVLLLYAFFHQMLHSPNGYYILSGLCMRCALVLGMHVEKYREDDDGADCSIVEHRRRLWWTIYNMDRYLSAKSGFPLSIPDESILTAFPQERDHLKGEFRYTDFPPARYIGAFIKVTQISSNMLMQLYQPSCVSSRSILLIISSIMKKLFDWKNDLSDDLKVNFNAENFQIGRTATNIYSEYHQCINLTVRPLLLHFVRKRIIDKKHTPIDLSNYPENVLTLLNASLEASILTIKSLNSLQEQNLFSTFGYLDREYAFSAASTLVMFNVAFALHNSSTAFINMAFDMLEKAERAGNIHVSHRVNQLRNFIGSFDFIDPIRYSVDVPHPGIGNQQGEGNNGQNVNQESNNTNNAEVKYNTDQNIQQSLPQQRETVANHTHDQQQQSSQYDDNQQQQQQHDSQLPPQSNDNNFQGIEELFSHAQPYEPAMFGGRDTAETDLWDEITNQGFWLGNVSDEFMNMIN